MLFDAAFGHPLSLEAGTSRQSHVHRSKISRKFGPELNKHTSGHTTHASDSALPKRSSSTCGYTSHPAEPHVVERDECVSVANADIGSGCQWAGVRNMARKYERVHRRRDDCTGITKSHSCSGVGVETGDMR